MISLNLHAPENLAGQSVTCEISHQCHTYALEIWIKENESELENHLTIDENFSEENSNLQLMRRLFSSFIIRQ